MLKKKYKMYDYLRAKDFWQRYYSIYLLDRLSITKWFAICIVLVTM